MKGDPSQNRAIFRRHGPCRIIAGPGSGKTFVLTQHILHLTDTCHVEPHSILAVTFSRAAAVSMADRFYEISSNRYQGITFTTFHAFFYHILQIYSKTKFRIIQSEKKAGLVKALTARFFPERSSDFDAADFISLVLSQGRRQSRGDYSDTSEKTTEPDRADRVYKAYRSYLNDNHLLDFDDLSEQCLQLLKSSDAVLGRLRLQYRYILIDEFQDISSDQFAVIKLLGESAEEVFAVGDDDQSIYSFRGSDPESLALFSAAFPGCETVRLQMNYRSTRAIVNAAGKIISLNSGRIQKEITAAGEAGAKPSILGFESDLAQYRTIAQEVAAYRKIGQTCAILLRSFAKGNKILRYLSECGINGCDSQNHIVSKRSILQEEICEDIRAYILLAEGHSRKEMARCDLYRILNRPERFLERELFPREKMRSLLDPGRKYESYTERELSRLESALGILSGLPPKSAVRCILDAIGYGNYIVHREKEYSVTVKEILAEIVSVSGRAKTLHELDMILSDAGIRQPSASKERPADVLSADVRIMTMHAAKGLEFDHVFIPDMNEGIMPPRRSRTKKEREEERRLFYVAMTRAKKTLHIYYVSGSSENQRRPSSFLMPLM